MSKTALWLTDLHVDAKPVRKELFALVEEKKPDLIFITGDIADQGRSHEFLEALATYKIPIYFVLGNHDFYGKELDSFKEKTKELASSSPYLHYLPALAPLQIDNTALVGIDNFYDMECGDPYNSPVVLNDFYYIGNFIGLSKAQIHNKVKALSEENVRTLEEKLTEALNLCDNVILLAHVTPFQESCLYNNQHSTKDWSPYFTNTHLGAYLYQTMQQYPEKNLTVLSGHTHHPAQYKPLPNLTAKVDGSDTKLTYEFISI